MPTVARYCCHYCGDAVAIAPGDCARCGIPLDLGHFTRCAEELDGRQCVGLAFFLHEHDFGFDGSTVALTELTSWGWFDAEASA